MQQFSMPIMRKHWLVPVLAGLLLAMPVDASVNRSVKIDDGETANGASSVNGSVTVGTDATVTGNVSTVNGAVRVGERSVIEDAETVNGGVKISDYVRADNLETVNGDIRVGENVTIGGDATTVNGGISIGLGSTVGDDVGNVNGDIELTGSQISGDVSTVNGDIELADGAVVQGDIIVEKARGWNWGGMRRKPRIVIGPGSRVEGTIRLEREVRLYISETAVVGGVRGEMTMDDAEIFSGDRP